MEFKGTKGDWKIGTAVQCETENVVVKTRDKIITVEDKEGKCVGLLGRADEEETQANAKLIAAAPEMFEVLKEVLKKMPLGACSEELQEIKQLLTKITQ